MNKKLFISLWSLVLVGALATYSHAADATKKEKAAKPAQAAPQEITVKGTITVNKDAKNTITSVELKGDDGTMYEVEPPSQWKGLEKDNGKAVEARGTVADKNGVKQLKVKSVNDNPPKAS